MSIGSNNNKKNNECVWFYMRLKHFKFTVHTSMTRDNNTREDTHTHNETQHIRVHSHHIHTPVINF